MHLIATHMISFEKTEPIATCPRQISALSTADAMDRAASGLNSYSTQDQIA